MALPVALQLYSVRDVLSQDYRGTLEQVKAMGYQGVELPGFSNGKDPKEVRKILEELDLPAMSCHYPTPILWSTPEKAFEDCVTAGCRYVAIPWLDKTVELAEENLEATFRKIGEIGKKAKEYGLTLLYHNHNFEFVMSKGKYILDRMYDEVPAEYLQTQLDTCWVRVGGEDPAEYVRKYTGRAPLVHLKDFYGQAGEGMFELIGQKPAPVKRDENFSFRPIGHGMQNIPPILEAAEAAGAQWVIVEQDSSPERPTMEAAKMSRDYLKSLGW